LILGINKIIEQVNINSDQNVLLARDPTKVECPVIRAKVTQSWIEEQ